MPRYHYHVAEDLKLNLDGAASGARVISLRNDSPDPAPILIVEFEEWFPESASDLAVFDITANAAITDAVIEDHHYSRRVRWHVPQVHIPGNSEYQFRVTYRRTYVAHATRGYFHLTVGYRSHQHTRYSLTLEAPGHIEAVHIKALRPVEASADALFTRLDGQRLAFAGRDVSMNKRFHLELSLDIIGDVAIPALPVVAFVSRQLVSGEWFPQGWEA